MQAWKPGQSVILTSDIYRQEKKRWASGIANMIIREIMLDEFPKPMASRVIRAGDRVRITKPKNLQELPLWESTAMDYLDGLTCEVVRIKSTYSASIGYEYTIVEVKESRFLLNLKWVSLERDMFEIPMHIISEEILDEVNLCE